jgi:hypothetical protein
MGNKCLQMHNMIVIIKYSRIVGNNEQLKLWKYQPIVFKYLLLVQ